MQQYKTLTDNLPELTVRGMILGALLTAVFTASNVYLGLKVGLTFSSAIPAAVVSMAILKWAGNSNILENNMVQTQASAAGTLSTIIFIIPGLLMIGYWQDFDFWQTLVISLCGGCMGVLFTIPLRRAMVVNSSLPYPEGRAAAEILKVGDKNSSGGAKEILTGSILSGFFMFCSNGLNIISEGFSRWFAMGSGISRLAMEYSTALFGAGYLMGIGAGVAVLLGVVVAWGVLVPAFTWGATGTESELIKLGNMVYKEKVRLIGAGTMGIAAISTLISLAKPVVSGIREAAQSSRLNSNKSVGGRTDVDMSFKSVGVIFILTLLGLLAVFYSFVSAKNLEFYQSVVFIFVGLTVAIATGFFVAAACAYMAGLVGTSSSPISGIGILGIIISSVVVFAIADAFNVFDMAGGGKFATALAIFITSVIIAIACISNDNMQDLKTGFIVGATPWKQQIALIIGCVVGSIVMAPALNLLYEAYGFSGAMPRDGMDESSALAAPQAMLMTTIAKGIFSNALAWEYIYMGLALGAVFIAADYILKRKFKTLSLPPLAVGMGIYLPQEMQIAVIAGAVVGYVLKKRLLKSSEEDVKLAENRGTLFASGLIVGESLMGVTLAVVIAISVAGGGSDSPLSIKDTIALPEVVGLVLYICIIVAFVKNYLRKR